MQALEQAARAESASSPTKTVLSLAPALQGLPKPGHPAVGQMKAHKHQADFKVETGEGTRTVHFSGDWILVDYQKANRGVRSAVLDDARDTELRFDCSKLGEWDTAFLATLAGLIKGVEDAGGKIEREGLPKGALALLELSAAVPEADLKKADKPDGFLEDMGLRTIAVWRGVEQYLSFVGQLLIDGSRLCLGKGTLRMREFFVLFQAAGPQAVPIVALLAFLTGLIIAFIGVIQLQKLGADIYVADLVGLVMTRELAAVMTGIIMAGRTGAAYAAQIGSMRVNEEIDALESFSISPMQFLVLPRVVALVIVMPLLVAFANVISIFGGMLVAVSISEVTVSQYHYQILEAVSLSDVLTGLFKSTVFGLIIALSGCFRGLACGKDAAAVGRATTSAVVTAITWIVVADAIFAVLFHIFGI